MSGGVLALIVVPISLLILICAVVIENRGGKSLASSILIVGSKCLLTVILANVLEVLHLLVWIGLDKGVAEAKGIAGAIAGTPVLTFFFLSRWDALRLLPLGGIVALASSGEHTRFSKIIRASSAAAITVAAIGFLFREQISSTAQPSILFLVVTCIVEGPIIGVLVGPIRRIHIRLTIAGSLVVFLAFLRKHPRSSTVVVVCVLFFILHWIHGASRVFLKLSGWREITIEYTDVSVLRRGTITSVLFTMFNSWPVAGGENIEWVSFKSAKKMLNFNFLTDDDVAVADPRLELIVSRVNDYPPLRDPLLENRYMRNVHYTPEVVYRGKTNPGTFTIDAPEFTCAVYSPNRGNAKANFIGVSGPLRTSFTVTRERQPMRLLVPGLKEVGPTKDWISVRTSNETLAFGFWAARDLMMFCRASRSSSKEGVRDIRISGKGFAKPIVIGPSGGAWKDQTGTTIVYPGFLVELKRPEGEVSVGTLGGSADVALGMASLKFVAGRVSTIQIRGPLGSMKIGADEVKQLDAMDEVSFGGKNLEISPGIEGDMTVQGQSRDITLDGVSLAKSILPKELDLMNLIEVVEKFFR